MLLRLIEEEMCFYFVTTGNINYKLLENTDSVLTQMLLFNNTSFDQY